MQRSPQFLIVSRILSLLDDIDAADPGSKRYVQIFAQFITDFFGGDPKKHMNRIEVLMEPLQTAYEEHQANPKAYFSEQQAINLAALKVLQKVYSAVLYWRQP
jgi:hypothetical protein